MELQILTTIVTGTVLAMLTAVIAWQGNGRFRRLESDIAEVRVEMRSMRSELSGEISGLRSELMAEVRDLRSDVASVRSDLTQVAIALGTHLRPQTG